MGKAISDPLGLEAKLQATPPPADPLGLETALKKKDTGGIDSSDGTPGTSPSRLPLSSSVPPPPRDPMESLVTLAVKQDAQATNPLAGFAPLSQQKVDFAMQTSADQNINPNVATRPKQQLAKRVQQGDIDAIVQVVKNEKAAIDADKMNLQQQAASPLNIKSNVEEFLSDGFSGVKSKAASFDKLNQQQAEVHRDAMQLIDKKLYSDYHEAVQKTNPEDALQHIGQTRRQALSDMGYNEQLSGVNDSSVKTDKARLDDLASGKNLDHKDSWMQEYKYKNDRSALDGLQDAAVKNLQQFDNDGVVDKFKQHPAMQKFFQQFGGDIFKAPLLGEYLKTGDADLQLLLQQPSVQSFVKNLTDTQNLAIHAGVMPVKYPEIRKAAEQQQTIEAFGELMHGQRSLEYTFNPLGSGWSALKNTFVGDKLDTDTEVAGVKEILKQQGIDISEDKIREYAKDFTLPSYLGEVTRGAWNMVANMRQYANRQLLSSTDADIANKDVDKNYIYNAPQAQSVSKSWSVDNVLRLAGNGFGQFLGYAGTSYLGGELLGVAGKLATGAARVTGAADALAEIPGVGRVLNLAGEFVAPSEEGTYAAGSAVDKVVRAGEKAREVATVYASGHASSYESAYQEAKQYGNDPDKWEQYAGDTAFLNGVSELILPDVQVAKKIMAVNGVKQLLREGKVLLSKPEIVKAYLGEVGKIMGQETLEEYLPYIGQALDKQRLFDYQTSTSDFMKGLWDTTTQTMVSTIPMAVLGGHGVNNSNFTKNTFFEIANTPEKYKAVVDRLAAQGKLSADQVNDRKKTIDTLADIKATLPQEDMKGNNLSQQGQVDMMSALMQHRYWSALKEAAGGDKSPLAKVYDVKIIEAQNHINTIMQGDYVPDKNQQHGKNENSRTSQGENAQGEDAKGQNAEGGNAQSEDEVLVNLADGLFGPQQAEQPVAEPASPLQTNLAAARAAAVSTSTGSPDVIDNQNLNNATTNSQEQVQEVNGNSSAGEHNNVIQGQQGETKSGAAATQSNSSDGLRSSGTQEEEILTSARPLVASLGDVLGATDMKEAAQNDPAKFKQYLLDIAEQATTNGQYDQAEKMYGLDLVDKAIRLKDAQENKSNETSQNQDRQDVRSDTEQQSDQPAESSAAGPAETGAATEAETVSPLQERLQAAREAANRPLTLQERLAEVRKQQEEDGKKRPIDKKAERINKKYSIPSLVPSNYASISSTERVNLDEKIEDDVRNKFDKWRNGGELARSEFIYALHKGWATMGDMLHFMHEQHLTLSEPQLQMMQALIANPNKSELLSVNLYADNGLNKEGHAGVIRVVISGPNGQRTVNSIPVLRLSDIILNPAIFNSDRLLFDVAMHEFAHRITLKELAENKSFADTITDLRKKALAEYAKRNNKISDDDVEIEYGLQNNQEFIASMYNHKPFVQFLKGVKLQSENVFQRIVDWISEKLFGKAIPTAYDQLSRIMSNYVATKSTDKRTLLSDNGEVIKDRTFDQHIITNNYNQSFGAQMDQSRQSLAQLHDVLMLAKQYAEDNKKDPEEFLRDKELLSTFNVNSPSELRSDQRAKLRQIFFSSTDGIARQLKAIQNALRSEGDVKAALKTELQKDKPSVKAGRQRIRGYFNSDTGKMEYVSTSGQTTEEREARSSYVDNVKQWTPVSDGTVVQDVKDKHAAMGLQFADEDYTRPNAKAWMSAESMRQLINSGINQFGKDYADVVREILTSSDVSSVVKNQLVTRLLEMKPFSIDMMQKLVQMDKKLATEWTQAGMSRRWEGPINEEMADELYDSIGENGQKIKDARAIIQSSLDNEDVSGQQTAYEEGITAEEAKRQTDEILNEKEAQHATTEDSLSDLKAKTLMEVSLMKQTHSVNADKAADAVKTLRESLIQRIKKIKC